MGGRTRMRSCGTPSDARSSRAASDTAHRRSQRPRSAASAASGSTPECFSLLVDPHRDGDAGQHRGGIGRRERAVDEDRRRIDADVVDVRQGAQLSVTGPGREHAHRDRSVEAAPSSRRSSSRTATLPVRVASWATTSTGRLPWSGPRRMPHGAAGQRCRRRTMLAAPR